MPAAVYHAHRDTQRVRGEVVSVQRQGKRGLKEHFIDLCRMVGVRRRTKRILTGDWYAFEKGAEKAERRRRLRRRLEARPLRLGVQGQEEGPRRRVPATPAVPRGRSRSPPLLVVCDLDRFEVHTNFTGTVKAAVHSFTLDDLRNASPTSRFAFSARSCSTQSFFVPTKTRDEITEEAAQQFAELAEQHAGSMGTTRRGLPHFLNRLLFCLFAEDAGVLPRGLMTRLLHATHGHPPKFQAQLADVLARCSLGAGSSVRQRSSGLTAGCSTVQQVLPLGTAEIETLRGAVEDRLVEVEPAILGTLFERGLDPAKRSQLGAHYTDRPPSLRRRAGRCRAAPPRFEA